MSSVRTAPSTADAPGPVTTPAPPDPLAGGPARPTLILATALAVVDVLLIAGNVVHLRVDEPDEPFHPVFSDPAWNGYFDNSYPELFGYAQVVFAVVVLGFVWRDRRAGVYAAWMVVLLAVLADDLLLLHERGGEQLVRAWELPAVAGLRPQDLGELAVWGLLAVGCLPALLIGHLRAGARDRRNSWILLGLMALLAVPAVLVDMLAVVLAAHVPTPVYDALTVLETAGELGAVTLILVVAHRMAVAPAIDTGGREATMAAAPSV